MPIEIRELIIRARVEESETASQSVQGRRTGTLTLADREAIIAACVEQVLKTLDDKRER